MAASNDSESRKAAAETDAAGVANLTSVTPVESDTLLDSSTRANAAQTTGDATPLKKKKNTLQSDAGGFGTKTQVYSQVSFSLKRLFYLIYRVFPLHFVTRWTTGSICLQ